MNPKPLTSDQRKKTEEKLSRLEGVLAAHIRVDGDGALEGVELDASAGVDRAAMVREAAAVMVRELGVEIDTELIRISEFEGRFAFVSVNVVSSREGLRAEVELTRESLHAFGAAFSENIAMPVWAVVAEATLRAISEYLDDAVRLCLIGVVKAPLGDDEAMLVRVDVAT